MLAHLALECRCKELCGNESSVHHAGQPIVLLSWAPRLMNRCLPEARIYLVNPRASCKCQPLKGCGGISPSQWGKDKRKKDGDSQGEVEGKVKEGPLTLTTSLSSLPLASSEPSLALGHCAHLRIQPPDFGEI